MEVTFREKINLNQSQILIGLDTLSGERGDLRYLIDLETKAPSGMEYLVILDSFPSSRLLAIEESDYTSYHFSSTESLRSTGEFQEMSKLINKHEPWRTELRSRPTMRMRAPFGTGS